MEDFTINFIAGPFLPIPPIKGGGVEVYLYNLALELAKKYKVRIYSRTYKGLKRRENIDNLEIVRISGFEKSGNYLLNIIKEFVFGFAILLNVKKANVNHFFHVKSFMLYLFRPNRTKSIVHLSVTFSGIASKFLKFADMVIPISNYIAKYFREKIKISQDKMRVIPNGVNIKQFRKIKRDDAIKKNCNLTDRKVLGYVGRIAREKGVEYLIETLRLINNKKSDIKLLLIGPYRESEYGDFKYYSYLLSLIKNYNLEKSVYFTGIIRHDELPKYYSVCDILVFPSDWEEPFGIVCIEALACGKPVIVTDSGAFREIITSGINGLIVPKKSPSIIANMVMSLLDDNVLRNNISLAAAARAESFSFEHIAQQYENLYVELKLKNLGGIKER